MRPKIALFLLVDSGQRKDDTRGLSGPVCLALTERLQIEDFLCARGIFRRFADICTQAALLLDFAVSGTSFKRTTTILLRLQCTDRKNDVLRLTSCTFCVHSHKNDLKLPALNGIVIATYILFQRLSIQ